MSKPTMEELIDCVVRRSFGCREGYEVANTPLSTALKQAVEIIEWANEKNTSPELINGLHDIRLTLEKTLGPSK